MPLVSQNNQVLLSIVIPCLNEEETIGFVLENVQNALETLHISSEILLSDNGSLDKSVEIAKEYGVRVISVKKRGYGNTLHTAILAAKGEYIIYADGDGSYDFSYLPKIYQLLKEGNDLVIGSRMRGKMEEGAMPFLHRYIGTPFLTFLINVFYGTKLSDSNSGMRGLRRDMYSCLDMKSEGMEYSSEILIKAQLLHLSLCEFPMNFYKDKRSKKPHLRPLRDGVRHLSVIFSCFLKRHAPFFRKLVVFEQEKRGR